MTGIRVLTVRQPWAWAIVHGGKDVENRTRSLGPYRGPVAIHAALQDDLDAWQVAVDGVLGDALAGASDEVDQTWSVRGAIIGVVDLVDSHPALDCLQQQHDGDWLVCSNWAERGGHHLVLANPRALDEPLPWKGGLGLRKSRLDIAGNWLVEQTDTCNCQAGSLESAYAHAPGCGLEQVARLIGATP